MAKACRSDAQRSQVGGDRPGQQGFTLIEVLVVVVILGILGAIALPGFLNQAARAKQAGALKYVGVVNRAQQLFFMEHNRFANSVNELGFLPEQAPADYTYTITASSPGVKATSIQAVPQDTTLRGYAGVVFATPGTNGAKQLLSHLCQGDLATAPTPTPVTVEGMVQITDCDAL